MSVASFVQADIAAVASQNTGETGASSLSNLAFPNNITAGNTVVITVIVYRTSSPTINTPTLAAGTATLGTITLATSTLGNSSSNYFRINTYYANVTGSGSATIGFSGTFTGAIAAINEYSGMSQTFPIYGTPVRGTGTSNTETPGSITTNAGGMALMSSTELSTTNFTYTLTDTAVYSQGNGATGMTGQSQYKLTPTGAAQTVTAKPGSNSWFFVAQGIAFQKATTTVATAVDDLNNFITF